MQLSQEQLRKAQLLMLKILKEVHRICEENNIKYFLSDGTLIGAVRHNGFIPWDDDLDIGMLREEYEKFCKIAPEKIGEEFVLQVIETDSGYAQFFGKVMLKDTLWVEDRAKDTNRKYSGIYIDIFPFDKVSKNDFLRRLKFKLFQYLNIAYSFKLGYKLVKSKISFILSKIMPKIMILKLVKSIIFSCRKSPNDKCYVSKYGGNLEKNKNVYNSYNDLVLHKFEDSSFYILKEYDRILSNLYGDYMIPPSNPSYKHEIVEYDFGPYSS